MSCKIMPETAITRAMKLLYGTTMIGEIVYDVPISYDLTKQVGIDSVYYCIV